MAHFEGFGLDPELLTRSADAHAGYAGALLQTERAEYLPWIASSALLGAVHRALVDATAARVEFLRAAHYYSQVRSSYWGILAVCAQDRQLVEQFAGEVRARESERPDPDELLVVTLAHAWAGEDVRRPDLPGQTERGVEGSERDPRHARVGRIGLPLGVYERALEVVAAAARGGTASQAPLWHAALLFERGAEPVVEAMRDRYHWERLHSTVLPVEPELIAAGLGMLALWRRARQEDDALVRRIGNALEDPRALIPLRLAMELGR